MENRNHIDTSVALEADEILSNVLGDREIAYIRDVAKIFSQHPQTTWRQYTATPPKFPLPIYNGFRRAWTRKTLKDELLRRMNNTKAA